MHSSLKSFSKIAGSIAIAGSMALTGVTAFADDDDDFEPEAYLYNAACDDLDAATEREEITDLDDDRDDETNETWTMLQINGDIVDGAYLEKDDIDDIDSVQDLINNNYAVVVHEEEDTDSAVLVCGNVTGTVEDDSVLIQLSEVDGSGWEGRAYLTPDFDDDDDDNDDEIDVAVAIFPTRSVEPLGTPEAGG